MRRIQNISEEAYQIHTITSQERDVEIELTYAAVVESWFANISYGDTTIYGVKLAVDVPLILSHNLPIDIFVIDNTGVGVDPVRLNDFSSERCDLLLLEADEVEFIRGQAVKL